MAGREGKFDAVAVTGIVITETAKATMMRIDGDETWIPKSQFIKPSIETGHERDEWYVFIPRWLAEEKELDYEEYEEWVENRDMEG